MDRQPGSWDNTRHYQRYKIRQHQWNVRGPDANTMGSGPRVAHSSGRSTPVNIMELDIDKVLPRQKRVSCPGYGALSTQIINMFAVTILFLSPGWGRTREDAANDPHLKADQYGMYGLWFTCYREVLDITKKSCFMTTTLIQSPGWWMSVQALGCVFLLLSIINTILISIYVFRIKSNRKWKLSLTHGLLSILNCCVIASSLIVFAIFFLDDSWWCCPNDQQVTETILYWAWYFGVLALITQFISACMTIAETVHLRR